MSWADRHRVSEARASAAEVALKAGDRHQATVLYAEAAEAELEALSALDSSKTRTRGVSAVSAVSLYFKAARYEEAESVAVQWMAERDLPSFAKEQLRNLLQSIWSEQVRQRAGVQFAPGQVLVSVKGGEIVEGGAPLDLIVEKVQVVQSLFYRTAEFLRDLPYRKHGPPPSEIRDSCRPWLFQAAPGSYQFAVAVQEPRQPDLFKAPGPAAKDVADHFLQILRAGIDDPTDALPDLVPNSDYRNTFLKLTRNLAPRGAVFSQLEIRSSDESTTLRLEPETRRTINRAIASARSASDRSSSRRETLIGILRAVHLDKDWLELTVDNDNFIRVEKVGEAIDDLIGPMVNKPVIVEVDVDDRGRKTFVDIEPND
jgi:hypothetical protein